jgi:hypothetical protein
MFYTFDELVAQYNRPVTLRAFLESQGEAQPRRLICALPMPNIETAFKTAEYFVPTDEELLWGGQNGPEVNKPSADFPYPNLIGSIDINDEFIFLVIDLS